LALLSTWLLGAAGSARAREGREHDPPEKPERSDLARIDRELKEQRALLQQVARSEQEHYEAVRRLLERQGGASGLPPSSPAAPGGPTEGTEPGNGSETSSATSNRPTAAPLTFARVTGHVSGKGPALKDVYVYLEGFRSGAGAGRNASLEIVQASKQFEPRFAVALLGTRLSFPNRDTFFHNVFSSAPVPFDLGTYRANEASPSVVLKTPGVVEIYCNIHAQMSAQVLVVPNRVFAKVNDDGSFRLDKVPVGHRKLVAWGPGMRPLRLDVNVPAAGTEVAFTLEPELPVRHKNKFGQPYGSYKD
jgi:plastocyanin